MIKKKREREISYRSLMDSVTWWNINTAVSNLADCHRFTINVAFLLPSTDIIWWLIFQAFFILRNFSSVSLSEHIFKIMLHLSSIKITTDKKKKIIIKRWKL